jgi:hypothetical protein
LRVILGSRESYSKEKVILSIDHDPIIVLDDSKVPEIILD